MDATNIALGWMVQKIKTSLEGHEKGEGLDSLVIVTNGPEGIKCFFWDFHLGQCTQSLQCRETLYKNLEKILVICLEKENAWQHGHLDVHLSAICDKFMKFACRLLQRKLGNDKVRTGLHFFLQMDHIG